MAIVRWLSVAASALLLVFDPAHAMPSYALKELGAFIGSDLNDRGEAVGTVWQGPTVLYSHGVLTDIGYPSDGNGRYTSPTALNNAGQVVGVYQLRDDTFHGQAFLYGNGRMTGLGPMGGPGGSTAYGINDAGEVVVALWPEELDIAIYRNGSVEHLGIFGTVTAINNLGQVLGTLYDDRFSVTGTFIYDHGAITVINEFTGVYGFSDSGIVAGYIWDGKTLQGAIWQGGKLTLLADSFGHRFTRAVDVNSAGCVVGTGSSPTRAETSLLYCDGQIVDLMDLPAVQAHAFANVGAVAINEKGQVLVNAGDVDAYRAYLLSPVPEPSSLTLMAGGMCCLVAVARRRGSKGFLTKSG